MANKMIALILTGFLFSGFSWGKAEESTTDANSGSSPAYSSAADTSDRRTMDSYSSKAMSEQDTDSENLVSPKRENRASDTKMTTPTAAPAGAFPSALISSLASGDEKERKARIESLRRLSQAMSQMNAPAAPVVAKKAEVSKKSF